jgi:hypothetical protein
MKVYVVMETAVIAHEEYERLMGVFSSEAKANEAMEEYKRLVNDSCWSYEYYWIDCEVDSLWEQ